MLYGTVLPLSMQMQLMSMKNQCIWFKDIIEEDLLLKENLEEGV